jgi:DNA-binding beta-propeller fold protein YncE
LSNPKALAAGASAFGLLNSFGGKGSAEGKFEETAGIAHDAAGDLYVVDQDTNRIEEWTAAGAFVRQWGAFGAGAGQMREPLGVAIAGAGEDTGDVYVTDGLNRRVDEFTAEGKFLRTWGFGVANGENKFEICTSSCENGLPSGSDEGGFEVPDGVAVDPNNGDVYVSDPGNSDTQTIYKYKPDGEFIGKVGLNPIESGLDGGSFSVPTALATDPAGDLYVEDSGNHRMQELDSSGKFVRAWGWDVNKGGLAFEICTVSTECGDGAAGQGAGELEETGAHPAASNIAIDSSGNVWVPEADNRRVQGFTSEGAFLMAFGWGVKDTAEALETCTVTCKAGIESFVEPRFEIIRGAAASLAGCGLYVTDADLNELVDHFETCPEKEKEKEIEKEKEKETAGGGGGSNTGGGSNSGGGSSTQNTGNTTTPGIASTAAAVEELSLGCGGRALILTDAYIHQGRVLLIGSAAKRFVGKKVKILFDEGRQVATATVHADGTYTTTAPLPPPATRSAVSTRYTAEIGTLRSVHLKLTRRLLLEPPRASGHTVTLTGQVTLPLTRPVAPVVVEQQLECRHTTIAERFTPPASGRFHITLTVPAAARVAIYTLKSKVAGNTHSLTHGFTTYSLPLPVLLG